jgi:hypothetical protein
MTFNVRMMLVAIVNQCQIFKKNKFQSLTLMLTKVSINDNLIQC